MISDIDWNRLLSLLVAAVYLIAAFIFGGGEAFMKIFLYLIFPMAAIWYGDELGDWTSTSMSPYSLHPITGQTPGIFVTIMGWVLLLLPIGELLGYIIPR